jgi:hypothetical protein
MVLRRTGKVQSASHAFVFEEPTLQLRAELTPTKKYNGTYRSLPSFFFLLFLAVVVLKKMVAKKPSFEPEEDAYS